MNLRLLAGNAALKGQLEAQTARRGLSHAYILSGPAGAGKRTLARVLAAAFVCRGQGDKPCLSCPDCRKAMGGIHPDISVIGDDGKDISVAQVRALRADAYVRPNQAGRKVYILENAQTMNASAQNAMLKLLEEGPPYAAFLLLTDNAAALLQTVRSRCETLALSPVTEAEAEDWLARRYPDRAREDIVRAARRCEGLLGRAVAELEGAGDTGGQARSAAPELIARLSAGTSWHGWNSVSPWRSGTGTVCPLSSPRGFCCCATPWCSAPAGTAARPTRTAAPPPHRQPRPCLPGPCSPPRTCWSGCAPPVPLT